MALFQSGQTDFANCTARAIPIPTLPGAKINAIIAAPGYNSYEYVPAGAFPNHGSVTVADLRFCNVTINYTSNGLQKPTTVQIWLPQHWNTKMQSAGGSGWTAGLTDAAFTAMTGMTGLGYAASTTNGGVTSAHPADWAYSSPGKVDMKVLEHYASTSLNDLSILTKSIITSYYGKSPTYAYWNGCSQGGRQGYMLAQKYPTAYNGIAASAAPITWTPLMIAGFWAQALMNEMKAYPDACQLAALTDAATKACDAKDGVVDGLVTDPDACNFDPYTLVGNVTSCIGYGNVTVTREAATVANTGWYGISTARNEFLHHGSNQEAAFTTRGNPGVLGPALSLLNYTWGLADVVCEGKSCHGKPHHIVEAWLKVFVLKDTTFNTSRVDLRMLDDVFDISVREFTEVIGTADPNLTAFRNAGGKLVGYHGLGDPIIPSKNSRRYVDAVLKVDPKAAQFHRHFEAAGVGHCYSGSGLFPEGIFDSLTRWVEHGEAPEQLNVTVPGLVTAGERILCPYPQKARYWGFGGFWTKSSYYCSEKKPFWLK
ncbi:tannase and feruloyl esterase [Microthyrium microscopicum]|uniref:Carboxylic ester hydrolase n=1 Tax=Microthyrium microscopicum TaxID=703497 RepID=A0A6A6URC3_9PEZI|nr:tannase and feruloyl esterase [Microthyrium microscopicum]